MGAFKLYMFVLEPFLILNNKIEFKNENYEIDSLIILMNWPILAATWEP